jgi:hypothetical protein
MTKMIFEVRVLSLTVISILSLIVAYDQHVNGQEKTIPGVNISTISELTDPAHVIRFQYPADWNIKVYPWGNMGYSALSDGDPMVELRTREDDFRDLVTIAMRGYVFPKNATLPTTDRDPNYESLFKIILENQCKCNINSSNYITSQGITLSGYPAYRLVYQEQGYEHYDDRDNNTYNITEIGTIIDGMNFLVQYRATVQSFPVYLSNVQKIIESLSIVSLPEATNATSFSDDSSRLATNATSFSDDSSRLATNATSSTMNQ